MPVPIRTYFEKNYRNYKYRVKELKRELEMLGQNLMPSFTTNYAPIGGHAQGLPTDKVYVTVEKLDAETTRINKQLNYYRSRVASMEELIKMQKRDVQKIVKLKLLKDWSFEEISEEFRIERSFSPYVPTYCRELYYKAFKNMQKVVNEQKALEDKFETAEFEIVEDVKPVE